MFACCGDGMGEVRARCGGRGKGERERMRKGGKNHTQRRQLSLNES